MVKLWVKTLNISFNASGAAAAARQGNVVMIVDVLDMSTTAEAALEAGAIAVLGASPDRHNVPVTVNPEKVGYYAGRKASKKQTGIIIAAEPRLLKEEKARLDGIQQVLKGIKRAGAEVRDIVPNIGREVVEIADFKDQILIVISPSGGAAFDAAYNYGAPAVLTGTIARTRGMKGGKPAIIAAERAIEKAYKLKRGITLVAASSNSEEDVLAAQHISQEILNQGFLQIK